MSDQRHLTWFGFIKSIASAIRHRKLSIEHGRPIDPALMPMDLSRHGVSLRSVHI